MTKAIKYALFLILVNLQFAFSQPAIKFSETGLQAGFTKAKAENKPLLLMCYTSWCPHCKHMKSAVFTESSVADFYNSTFVCVAQDMEKGDGIKLKDSLKIASFPTFIFYDSNGNTIYRVEGEFKPAAFIDEGKSALTRKKQLPFLKQAFDNDVSNSTNCYTYVRALKKGGLDVSTVVNQYFATQSDKQLLSEVNWRIFANGVSDFNSRTMQFVIHHQREFSDITSPERVKRKLDYEVKALLNPLVETVDTIDYPIKRKLAAQIHSFSTDSLIFTYDLSMYESTNKWEAYKETCLLSAETFVWKNRTQLNDISSNFLTHIPDKKALEQAEQWAQRSLALDPEYDTYLICARIYQKLNNSQDAIKMAKKAKDLSVKFGWEGTESEKLLKELNSPVQ